MKKFELCSELDGNRILIPQLLEIVEPNFNFDYEASLKFIVHYNDFLPLSIIPRFIVKCHHDIKETLRWRTGVVLENPDFKSTAVVRADVESHRIYIDVVGQQPKDYLAVILSYLRIINDSTAKR